MFTTLYGITFRWWQLKILNVFKLIKPAVIKVVNYKIKNISEER
jgi:hypothetical protein